MQKGKQETPAERLYKQAYEETKQDFYLCDSILTIQSNHIKTLNLLIVTKNTRISKFESIVYRRNGKKRRALGVFLVWINQRKKF